MDIGAIEKRRALIDENRDKFVYRGVNFADALDYDLLPKLLPRGDPAE